MNLSRKPAPQKLHATALEHIDPEKISLYQPGKKPMYTGKMPTAEDEEKQADWDAVRERSRRLLATKRQKHLQPPAILESDLDPDHNRDLEQALLASELCGWLTGDVDRERRARLHQSRLDHARKSYYCTGAPLQQQQQTGHTETYPESMGSVLFRPPKDSESSPSWIASQVDMRTAAGKPQRTASKCYVKGYTPRKVTRPERSKSSLELV